ncbi:MAG: EamA/RhaT family transporter, partial [Pygmaiobacter sp.]
MNHKKAMLLTCFVALIWSLAGLNIKMITWTPYAIAGGRSLVAALLLTPLVLKSGKICFNRYVMGGALCYAAFNYCFIISTKL